jgi:nicotinamide phosphoribosyltransferase
MLNIIPVLFKDFYKTSHPQQYPKGTSVIYSNFTPRCSRINGIESIVVFGIQYFVKEYLIRQFNENFFGVPKEIVINNYKRRMVNSLGSTADLLFIESLHDLGYLPIEIKAITEGSRCPMRVPCLTIKNTHPDFFWLTNMLETLMSQILWGMMNSATIAAEYKLILKQYSEKTSDIPEFVQWQGHDFSERGMFGLEASLISGAAHLLSFTGTDTIAAIDFLEKFYGADSDKELIGGSIPATEHSVMCFGNYEDEYETYKRLLTDVYPSGFFSVVSDTWDYWKVLTETLPRLKKEIMSREGRMVVRPDSGDPVDIICGFDHVERYKKYSPHGDFRAKGSIQILWETFGGTINSKGYKQLDPHIGLIYGDSITVDRCKEICKRLERNGFASTNVVLGIGSYTYQYNTRDTFGFAVKSTYGVVNGIPVNIFKKPKTDNGIKNSAKGLLYVNSDMLLEQEVTPEREADESNELKVVFRNGKIVSETTLSEIRRRLNG